MLFAAQLGLKGDRSIGREVFKENNLRIFQPGVNQPVRFARPASERARASVLLGPMVVFFDIACALIESTMRDMAS